jgi:hypothetical protein
VLQAVAAVLPTSSVVVPTGHGVQVLPDWKVPRGHTVAAPLLTTCPAMGTANSTEEQFFVSNVI